jgi:hypothetical protein
MNRLALAAGTTIPPLLHVFTVILATLLKKILAIF